LKDGDEKAADDTEDENVALHDEVVEKYISAGLRVTILKNSP
jgi:hypothetical protein